MGERRVFAAKRRDKFGVCIEHDTTRVATELARTAGEI